MRKWISLGLISSFILVQASVATPFAAAEGQDNQQAESKIGKVSTKGNVGFSGNTDPDIPVKPDEGSEIEEPIITDDGATQGPYSISYISNLNFGTQYFDKKKDNTFFAKNDEVKVRAGGSEKTVPMPNFIQISDASAKSVGWKLSVSLEGPLKNENETEIKNMSLRFNNMIVKPVASDQNADQNPANIVVPKEGFELSSSDNSPKLVAEASGMQGQGRWHVLFGKTIENGEKSVSIHFPKNAIKEEGRYTTNLVWNFGDVK